MICHKRMNWTQSGALKENSFHISSQQQNTQLPGADVCAVLTSAECTDGGKRDIGRYCVTLSVEARRWFETLRGASQQMGVTCHSTIRCSLDIAVETIHRLLLYASQSDCCVCVSPLSHPRAESPQRCLLAVSRLLQSVNNPQSGTETHSVSELWGFNKHRTVELLKVLVVFIVAHRLSFLCFIVRFCTAKHRASTDIYWRHMGSTKGRLWCRLVFWC
jgi:hypothetical protein